MKKTAALKLKPPLSKRIKIRLLYDGFFSFAVVRQIILLSKKAPLVSRSKVLLIIGSASVRLAL
jgi:hypothetical protein